MNKRQQILERLQTDAEGLSSRNHERYMQDASECLQRTGSPQAALKLLESMVNTPFASRGAPLEALEGVIDWLRMRLNTGEAPTAEGLRWELGWLRRLARYADRTQSRGGNPSYRHDSDRPMSSGQHDRRSDTQSRTGESRSGEPRRSESFDQNKRGPAPSSRSFSGNAGFGTLADKLKAVVPSSGGKGKG